jgi:hypothetical protein
LLGKPTNGKTKSNGNGHGNGNGNSHDKPAARVTPVAASAQRQDEVFRIL